MPRRYGWIRDHPDQRDRLYSAPPRQEPEPELPPKVTLRPDWPGILDQGDLGSCVWNAISSAFLFCLARQSAQIFQPSRLFGYYNTRLMEGSIDSDAGCMIRDAVKSLASQGVCDEKQWPYLPARFARKPTLSCYKHALGHQSLEYFRLLQDLWMIRACLVEGFPFVVGISLYQSFEGMTVAKTGRVPLPKPAERMVGGHAVTVIGYDDRARRFHLANSWGEAWGDRGFFTLPYAYLTNPDLAADLWTLRVVEGDR
jgi:C1A family cysteine protease